MHTVPTRASALKQMKHTDVEVDLPPVTEKFCSMAHHHLLQVDEITQAIENSLSHRCTVLDRLLRQKT